MKNKKYWCWWKSRYLLLVDKVEDRYIMQDFGDEIFVFTQEDFLKLEAR